MEVLSIGEKIKRARIYKGFTLKDVCGDDISVSKLSCIENGKIMPEDWVLESISKKLSLDSDYLKQGIDEQINKNINSILGSHISNDLIKELKYNLEVAEKHRYYDLAFYIMHLIFDHLVTHDNLKSAQELIGRYYDLRNNSSEKAQKLLYYIDVARFFYRNNEYVQAANYFNDIRNRVTRSSSKDYAVLAESIYGEAVCNLKLENYTKAYEISKNLNELFKYVKDKIKKAKMYHMLAVLALRMDNGKFEYYEEKSYEMYEDKNDYKAEAIFNYGSTMFQVDMKKKAIEYIEKALEIYPDRNMDKLVNFMLLCNEELVNNGAIIEAEAINENALNYAINLNSIKFIEKAYYLKAKILRQQNTLMSAEVYMNLSLDALSKFGTKRQLYERYMEMGKMYYDMNSASDALKYFTLAVVLQKKL